MGGSGRAGRLFAMLRRPVLQRTGLLSVLTLGVFAILVVTAAFGLLFGRYRDELDFAVAAGKHEPANPSRGGDQPRVLTRPLLTVGKLESRPAESGYGRVIFGVLRNDTDTPAPDVAVVVSWYDAGRRPKYRYRVARRG